MSGAGLRFYNEVDLNATPFDPFSLLLIQFDVINVLLFKELFFAKISIANN